MNIQCLQHDPPYTLYSIASLKIHDVSNDAVNKIDLRSESAFLVSETKVKKVSPEETVKRALVQINLREDQSFAGNSNIILITDPIHFLGLVHLPKSFSGKIVATEAAVQVVSTEFEILLVSDRLANIY